jgi:hypothetical protein
MSATLGAGLTAASVASRTIGNQLILMGSPDPTKFFCVIFLFVALLYCEPSKIRNTSGDECRH